jgi:hypothetical protein
MNALTGAQKAIFRRGCKYAEQVGDHSKTAISVMFCGSATGQLLPPYVVYKGSNVYDSWCAGGPKGAVYTSSPSGWFDMFIFGDWFKKIFLPAVRRLPGKKLLLGDNLASHISPDVIQICKEENIQFVCLPANSTDKLQPLDVGFFGPMKNAWRKQLKGYADKDPTAKLLLKTEFPRMVKELITSLSPDKHLPAAFEKCGLFPIDREKVLSRIPSIQSSEAIARHVDAVLLKKLEVRRFGDGKKKPRGKKVPAGQSYSRVEEESAVEDDDSDSELEDEVSEEEKDDEVVEGDELEKDDSDGNENEDLPDLDMPRPTRKPGSFVVALYEGEWFVAEVVED